MKNVYITWHYTTHGIAFLKHILSSFYQYGDNLPVTGLQQDELNTTFDKAAEKAFVFDEVIYLTADQEAFDRISSRRIRYNKTILEDEMVIKYGLKDVFNEIIENENSCCDLEADFTFVRENYPRKFKKFEKVIWRNIQHYPITEQIEWLTKYSNFKNIYTKNHFNVIPLNVSDLRNEKQISDEVSKWSREYFSNPKNIQPFINVSLGSTETQVVWHILAEAGQLPENTRFIKTYDDKSDPAEKRFKRFSIQEIPTNLISSIGADFRIYNETKSASRELVNKKMTTFLNSGFSILLRGERGTGKSRIAKDASKLYQDRDKKFITANCASFEHDNMAESELFGYEPGTFTGGLKGGKNGKFIEADKGILFLDEIHHLSKAVQAKLMTAIQTKENGIMEIWKLGSLNPRQIKCNLVFASNKTIPELKECLLPDFYDRIVQHVIEIPPLRETKNDREKDWVSSWEHLFGKVPRVNQEAPAEPELIKWLKELPLFGNWRDLEKIAMYYHVFNQFDEKAKQMDGAKNAFQYAKREFEKYHSSETKTEQTDSKFIFSLAKTAAELEADFKFALQEWAVNKHGSRIDAAKHLGVTEKALNDWKNRKSLKNK